MAGHPQEPTAHLKECSEEQARDSPLDHDLPGGWRQGIVTSSHCQVGDAQYHTHLRRNEVCYHKPQATSHKPQATSHKPQATNHKG